MLSRVVVLRRFRQFEVKLFSNRIPRAQGEQYQYLVQGGGGLAKDYGGLWGGFKTPKKDYVIKEQPLISYVVYSLGYI